MHSDEISQLRDGGVRGAKATQQIAAALLKLSEQASDATDATTKMRPPETPREIRQMKRAVKQARRIRSSTPATRTVKPSAREIHKMRLQHWEPGGIDKHGRAFPARLVTDPWPPGYQLPLVRIHL